MSGPRAPAGILLLLLVECTASTPWVDDFPYEQNPYCVDGALDLPIATGEGPGPSELCMTIAVALCEQWARCGCVDVDMDACPVDIAATCDGFVQHLDVVGALERGTLAWSGQEASAFVAELAVQTAGCERVDLDVSRVAVGNVADGDECTDISGAFSECIAGSSCQTSRSWDGRRCVIDPWDTVPHQKRGHRCSTAFMVIPCSAGLRCAPRCGDRSAGICAPTLALGERCHYGTECESSWCSESLDFNVGGVCAEPRAPGELCEWSSECTTWCNGGACEPLSGAEGICLTDDGCSAGKCVFARRGWDPSGNCAVNDGRPGDPCGVDEECSSGACESDRCVDAVCWARLDPTGHGSFWQHPLVLVPGAGG